jgi:hypothetical protein
MNKSRPLASVDTSFVVESMTTIEFSISSIFDGWWSSLMAATHLESTGMDVEIGEVDLLAFLCCEYDL